MALVVFFLVYVSSATVKQITTKHRYFIEQPVAVLVTESLYDSSIY